jgi:hypothetical protein
MIQKPKTEDPIEEIHRIRREISDRFGGDIAAIAADAARRARESGRPMWQPKTTNHLDRDRGPVARDPSHNT